MENNLLNFCAILEHQVDDLKYGTLTVNVILVNGVPKLETLNMVRIRRNKYFPDKPDKLAEI
jgi:hypothetical protein